MTKKLEAALGYPLDGDVVAWLDFEGDGEEDERGWCIGGIELDLPAKSSKAAAKLLVDAPLLVLAGLVPFARDASGDQMFVSVRDGTPVRFDHETGEMEDGGEGSIAAFVAGKPARKRKPDKRLGPIALWRRVHWLVGLVRGEPAFEIAGVLAQAPPFAAWKKEAAEPLLLPYWMLAHAFLGNDEACREAAKAARTAKGWIVRELAQTVLAYCDGKKRSPIEKLAAAKFREMRAIVAKNALPALLAKPPKPSTHDAAVKAHDAALAKLATGDATRQALVTAYLRERDAEAYNHWPWKQTLPDWIVPAAAAAFRAGLAVDLGHPRAYAGVSRALAGRADHPDARGAMIAAVEVLAPGDGRLEHAVAALLGRDEPEAREAVRAGAWRWLAAAQGIDKVLAKRQARFSLDDVFAKDDRLQPLVHAVLERCDDEAEKLALAISDAKLTFRVLKRTAGLLLRVYGARGIAARYERIAGLIALLDNADQPLNLDETASVAMAEASLALARLDPARARPLLEGMFARDRRDDETRAGVVACLLPGLLHLAPANPEYLVWLERVLGTRGGVAWIYGALRAARGIPAAAPWVRPHAYARQLDDLMEQFAFLEAEAHRTLATLGENPPLFDEDGDKFASDIPAAALGPALARRDRHSARHVLERMEETGEPAYIAEVTAWLAEHLRASRYEPESHFLTDELRAAIRYLKSHDAPIALPDLGAWARTLIATTDAD